MELSYSHILVRYGELSLKGKNRRQFIKRLSHTLKTNLHSYEAVQVEAQHDRLFIYLNGCDPRPIEQVVSKVFGISSYSLALQTPSQIESIMEGVMGLLDLSQAKTFKVIAKRNDKTFPIHSDQINRMIASKILTSSDWKVDVHQPEVPISIEIRQQATYIMTDKKPGAGGFPVGASGKGLMLLSGGIDSPVAAYLMMRRGVFMEAIHFASPPYTSHQAQEKVMALAKLLKPYQGRLRVHVVPFTNLQLSIYEHVPESYAITIMRRMMMRIADGLAHKIHASVLATGESIGQVASQTLESMETINAVISRPILRPLVTMDKVDIIDLARKIDTYQTSILPFEDCCTIFEPKNPVTKPRIDKAEAYEKRFDFMPMVQACIDEAEVIDIQEEELEDLF